LHPCYFYDKIYIDKIPNGKIIFCISRLTKKFRGGYNVEELLSMAGITVNWFHVAGFLWLSGASMAGIVHHLRKMSKQTGYTEWPDGRIIKQYKVWRPWRVNYAEQQSKGKQQPQKQSQNDETFM